MKKLISRVIFRCRLNHTILNDTAGKSRGKHIVFHVAGHQVRQHRLRLDLDGIRLVKRGTVNDCGEITRLAQTAAISLTKTFALFKYNVGNFYYNDSSSYSKRALTEESL